MATIKAKIQSLINKANNTTGKSDTDLTGAVKSLAEGYGQGGEPWDETDPDNIIIEGEPIPDSNLIEQTFDENGVYLASDEGADGYSKVTVNVPVPEGDTLAEFLKVRNGNGLFYFCSSMTVPPEFDASVLTTANSMFYECSNMTSVPLYNTSNVTNMGYMFYNCQKLTAVPLFDTSNVTNMSYMFYRCGALTEVPLFNTSNVKDMGYTFEYCSNLTSLPLLDTSNVTNMTYMFYDCYNLVEVPLFNTSKVTNMNHTFTQCSRLTTVPLFDTSKATDIAYMFYNCKSLTSVPALDVRAATNTSSMFSSCSALTDIRIRNIKTNLQVGSGTSYGHLLTVDSLTHLIYELIKQSSAKTLTVGTANLEKLANVYVKAVEITDEMRAEDDLIDEKYPFVRCESTDEGAMLITTYASTIKSWTIK